MGTSIEDFHQLRVESSFHLHKLGQTLCFEQIREVKPLLRKPFQVQKLGYSHILHWVYHLEVVLILVCEPCIKPVESNLRTLSLLPLGGLGLFLSSGGDVIHLQKRNRFFKGRRKLGIKNWVIRGGVGVTEKMLGLPFIER